MGISYPQFGIFYPIKEWVFFSDSVLQKRGYVLNRRGHVLNRRGHVLNRRDTIPNRRGQVPTPQYQPSLALLYQDSIHSPPTVCRHSARPAPAYSMFKTYNTVNQVLKLGGRYLQLLEIESVWFRYVSLGKDNCLWC